VEQEELQFNSMSPVDAGDEIEIPIDDKDLEAPASFDSADDEDDDF
jgi:hypothetical protein